MLQPSRRDFLKHTTTTALSATALSALSSRAFAAGDDTIRIGLVGCGGRGTGAAAQTLQAPGKVKLVAIGDAFRDQLDGAVKRITKAVEGNETAMVDVPPERQFDGFDAYKGVIDSGIDLVVLATPPGFRPQHFAYAVEKGVHVFMEKPVAVDAAGVRQVLEVARKAREKNLKVGVGLQRRHEERYLDMVKRIADGAIGDIVAMRVYWNNPGVWEPRKSRDQVATEMEYQMRNWYYYNWLSGDHIVEQHIHNLDVGCWLKGQFTGEPNGHYPVKAQGCGGRQVRADKRYGEIYDHHAVEFTFADGSFMFSECRHMPNCWQQVTEHALGTKAIAHLANNRNAMSIEAYGGGVTRIPDRANEPYQDEHNALHAAIRSDQPFNEAEYGAKSTMVAILGRMCTYSGAEITWEQAFNSEIAFRPQAYAWDAMPPTVPNADGEYPIPTPGVTRAV